GAPGAESDLIGIRVERAGADRTGDIDLPVGPELRVVGGGCAGQLHVADAIDDQLSYVGHAARAERHTVCPVNHELRRRQSVGSPEGDVPAAAIEVQRLQTRVG